MPGADLRRLTGVSPPDHKRGKLGRSDGPGPNDLMECGRIGDRSCYVAPHEAGFARHPIGAFWAMILSTRQIIGVPCCILPSGSQTASINPGPGGSKADWRSR